MDTNTTGAGAGQGGQALPEDEGPVFISEEDILEVYDVDEGACVYLIREQRTWQALCVWIDRFRSNGSFLHPIPYTHADAPPLESDDDDDGDENADAAAAGATADDDEEGGDDHGMGGGGGGVRFVAEYEDGTMEEHAPPPDMAAEVCVGVYMQYCVSRCGGDVGASIPILL